MVRVPNWCIRRDVHIGRQINLYSFRHFLTLSKFLRESRVSSLRSTPAVRQIIINQHSFPKILNRLSTPIVNSSEILGIFNSFNFLLKIWNFSILSSHWLFVMIFFFQQFTPLSSSHFSVILTDCKDVRVHSIFDFLLDAFWAAEYEVWKFFLV